MVKIAPHQLLKNACVVSLFFGLNGLSVNAAEVWNYQWQAAIEVDSVPMLPVAADVIAASQKQLSLALAYPVTVSQWFVQSGEQVNVGQPLVLLSGPELLSLNERLDIAEHHADAAARRLTDNRQRYEQGDITREMWLEWQHQAHQTELELKALQQQSAVLKKWQAKTDDSGFILAAPVSGSVSFNQQLVAGRQLNAAEQLLTVASSDKLQLEFMLPLTVNPAAISFAGCELEVIWHSQQVNLQRRIWRSDYLTADCQATMGEKLVVQPRVAVSAYKVSRKSLIQTETSDGVIANSDKPVIVDVKVLAREGDWIYVQGDLAGRLIATADVAALKGHLMGLGAEQ